MDRRLFWGIVIGLLLFAALGSAIADQPRRGGTLRIAYEADITGMDPPYLAGHPSDVCGPEPL